MYTSQYLRRHYELNHIIIMRKQIVYDVTGSDDVVKAIEFRFTPLKLKIRLENANSI